MSFLTPFDQDVSGLFRIFVLPGLDIKDVAQNRIGRPKPLQFPEKGLSVIEQDGVKARTRGRQGGGWGDAGSSGGTSGNAEDPDQTSHHPREDSLCDRHAAGRWF